MHWTRFAPLLSATSRLVCIWIMGLDLRRLLEDLGHAPALVLGHRARLDHPDAVADLALLLLVVSLVLLGLHHDLAVLPVRDAALDLDDHGLGHLVRDDHADTGLGGSALHVATPSPSWRPRRAPSRGPR